MDSSSDDDWDDLRSASPASQFTSVTVDSDAHSAYQLVVASGTSSIANHLPPQVIERIIASFSKSDLPPLLRVNTIWSRAIATKIWHTIRLERVAQFQKIVQSLPTSQNSSFVHSPGARISVALASPNSAQLTPQSLAEVIPNFPFLEALQGDRAQISDAVLIAAPSAITLRGLDVAHSLADITDLGIINVASRSLRMERVILTGNSAITDESVITIVNNCPNLNELRVALCPLITDRAIRRLCNHSKKIREIDLRQCYEITDSAFVVDVPSSPDVEAEDPLANAKATAPILPNVRLLDLTGCSKLTDAAIEAMVVEAPKLREIKLDHCSNLTDNAVFSISKLAKHLHNVSFHGIPNITDAAVLRLATKCPRLRYVDFEGCLLLTDASVLALAPLPKLRRVGFVRVSNLTDTSINALAEHRGSPLERAHFSYCPNISVKAIENLLSRCRKLNHLSLSGVQAFMKPDYQQFGREPPKDFTTPQRSAYCIWSGHGLKEFGRHLSTECSVIAERRSVA